MLFCLVLLAFMAPSAHAQDMQPSVTLAQSEALGGHTLARHVGRTELQLRERLAREPRIPAAGTFPSRNVAEAVVAEALDRDAGAIARWLPDAMPGATRGFNYTAGRPIGQGVIRATDSLVDMSRIRLVLRRTNGPAPYVILTAYPVP